MGFVPVGVPLAMGKHHLYLWPWVRVKNPYLWPQVQVSTGMGTG